MEAINNKKKTVCSLGIGCNYIVMLMCGFSSIKQKPDLQKVKKEELFMRFVIGY